ncbi:MAG: helix-turn-helix transcriptional regulator [Deltaproteobacteria bacterium]|nr:helix-turn-helix transcriptional regulator [Deltaproteobacteria bacterium]
MNYSVLARAIGVTPQHISAIFRGTARPSSRVAKKLEDVTGIPAVTWLYAPLPEIVSAFDDCQAPNNTTATAS